MLKKTKDMVEFNNFEEPHDYYRSIAPLRLLRVKQKCPEVWERLGYLMDHNEDRIKVKGNRSDFTQDTYYITT